MPKPLQTQSSDSPIAKILDQQTTAQVLTKSSTNQHTTTNQQPASETKATKLTGEPVNISREFHLTRRAARTLKTVVNLYGEALGGPITNSHFLRALLMVVEDAMPHLEEEAEKLNGLKRPSNAPGFEAEREDFERKLAEAILAGMRAYGQARRPARQHASERHE